MANTLSAERVEHLGKILNDANQSMKARFKALYTLRYEGSDMCIEWMGKVFVDTSILIKHEAAYCLGQTQNKKAIPILINVLEDHHQEGIVRHEAGEGLGALGDPVAVPTLKKYLTDEDPAVAQTCEIAIARINWAMEQRKKGEDGIAKSPFNSIDPTPGSTETSIPKLGRTLIDPQESLFDRYRAMFSLRNYNTTESLKMLAKGLHCNDSALLRHEVAYALGQTRNPVIVDELLEGLSKVDEHHIVRHECAEALGNIGTQKCDAALRKYLNDRERIVRETCTVGLAYDV